MSLTHKNWNAASDEDENERMMQTTSISFHISSISSSSEKIRRWGCHRTETPLIFIHIGKAGGGGIRARLAASSLNYTKKVFRDTDNSYYPIQIKDHHGPSGKSNNNNTSYARGIFCNSQEHNYLPIGTQQTYEKTIQCHAQTPIGQAIACPGIYMWTDTVYRGCCQNKNSNFCHVVYVGHNTIGSEMHWLPAGYLMRWWQGTRWFHHGINGTNIYDLWKTLHHNETWCKDLGISRPTTRHEYQQIYKNCSVSLESFVDDMATNTIVGDGSGQSGGTSRSNNDNHNNNGIAKSHGITSWSQIYASMPLLRVTMVRDPFSWFVSKFFWHSIDKEHHIQCDDIDVALAGTSAGGSNESIPSYHSTMYIPGQGNYPSKGWIHYMAMEYILYLCGEDCSVRMHMNTSTLVDLEYQAKENLRNSFAVVGLLNETTTFYDMITKRVQYINTSLNMHVTNSPHSTNGKESTKCKKIFANVDFQNKLIAASPEIAAANRLYYVALEVNRFQLNELESCTKESSHHQKKR